MASARAWLESARVRMVCRASRTGSASLICPRTDRRMAATPSPSSSRAAATCRALWECSPVERVTCSARVRIPSVASTMREENAFWFRVASAASRAMAATFSASSLSLRVSAS